MYPDEWLATSAGACGVDAVLCANDAAAAFASRRIDASWWSDTTTARLGNLGRAQIAEVKQSASVSRKLFA